MKELQNTDEYKELVEWATQYTEEEYTEEMMMRRDKMLDYCKSKLVELCKGIERAVAGPSAMKQVWFTISEFGGQYKIMMFYENRYNEADGSDL